ncbi:MAG: hypothetical protein IID13_09165, partial [Candidatus Marinimicrobia bacterium]|nr:hypothetical protein [Candidatus Neomarinimicrobiota bacterium]
MNASDPTPPTQADEVRTIHVVGVSDIPNGGTVQVAFAVVGGDNLPDLQANADAARAAFLGTQPPAAPMNVQAYGGSGAAAITWDANTETDISYYSVYRSIDNNPDNAAWNHDINVPYTHYIDYPGVTDEEYFYWVTATNQGTQESAESISDTAYVDPPLAHQGGPDNWGYEWRDSRETDGPAVEWSDITASGIQSTPLNLGDDTFSLVPLPFSFPFYENNYTQVKISSNGYLAFGPEGVADLGGNEDQSGNDLDIPNPAGANNFIAAFWADLNPDPADGGGGTIHYYDDAANNRFIVQYTNVPFFQEPQTAPGKSGKDGASVMPVGKFDTGGGKAGLDISVIDPQDALIQLSPGKVSAQMATDFTFQVQLYDDGAILFQYLAMNGLTDQATVGIENAAGDDGLAAVERDFLVTDNYAIGFKPPGFQGGPWAFTAGAIGITSNSATLVAEVMPDGVETEVFFDYWDMADESNIRAIPQIPILVSGTAIVPVSATLTNLIAGHTYRFQVMAIQAGGDFFPSNQQLFTTPSSENEVLDVVSLPPDAGVIEFPSTNIGIVFDSFTPGGDDVIEVAQITGAPGGTLPPGIELLTTNDIWRIDYFSQGTPNFSLQLTFELGAGGVPLEIKNTADSLKLVRRNSDGTGAWTVAPTTGSSATDSSITFSGVTGFSQFIVGTSSVDKIAPQISGTGASPLPVPAGAPVTVTAMVSDNRGTPVVELIYLPGGGGIADTSIRTMQEGNPGQFSYTIPGSEVRFTGLLVQIKAVDAAGNDSVTAPVSLPVSYGDNTLATNTLQGMYGNGIPAETWRLFSVPSFLDNPSLSANIGFKIGVESGNFTWKVFAYNSSNASYTAPINLSAGAGYWIHQRVTPGLQFSLTAGKTKDLEGLDIELAPGWNLIGNPFPFSFPVQFNDSLFSGPITYDGSGWSANRGTMVPWGGYAVYNRSVTAETLTLRAIPGTLLLAKNIEPEELDGWLMHLAVRGERYTDVANAIGRIQGASEQLDRFDAPEPPFIDGYITLVMERPEWGGNLTALSSDIRSWEETDGTWDLQLRTKNSTGPIALTTQLEGDLPAGNKVVLMDLQQRAVYDLTAGEVPAAITGYSERYPYYLKVMAGSAEYVDQAVDEVLAQLPVDFALAQNYPNPFNPTTRLQYSLIRPAPVSLKIYNLLGQEITTLYEGWQDLGRFEVVWDGRDRYGNGVAAGSDV